MERLQEPKSSKQKRAPKFLCKFGFENSLGRAWVPPSHHATIVPPLCAPPSTEDEGQQTTDRPCADKPSSLLHEV